LFSATSELLFYQLLCFHKHLPCPIVFFLNAQIPGPSALRTVLSLSTLFSSAACRLIVFSLRVFPHSSPLFSIACSLFCKNTRVWGYPTLSSQRYHLRSFKTGGRRGRRCRRTRLRQVLAGRCRSAKAARGLRLCRAPGAGRWLRRRTAR
jgi:hypothetical protein